MNQIKSSSWMKTISWFYICGWMIKQRRQILEPNKMTVQNGMKRITEWMEWMVWMDGWMDGRTDGWTDGRMDGPQMQIICRVGIKRTK